MATYNRFCLLLILLTAVTSAAVAPIHSSISASPTPSSGYNTTTTKLPPPPPHSPSPPPRSETLSNPSQDRHPNHQQQLNNIIDALIGAGDFTNWANMLSSSGSTTLPLSATIFIPADDSLPPPTTTTTVAVDPLIFPYHVVPQRLTFSELRQFKLFSRLPTLLAKKSILITNNSLSNFSLDGSRLSHPDLYVTASMVVHGIASLLDYSVYGDPYSYSSKPQVRGPPPLQSQVGFFTPSGELISNHYRGESGAGRLCPNWNVLLMAAVCAGLASKVQIVLVLY